MIVKATPSNPKWASRVTISAGYTGFDPSGTETKLVKARMTTKRQADLEHYDTCKGCKRCDGLMEFISGCDTCGHTFYMADMTYFEDKGIHLCDKCVTDESNWCPDCGQNHPVWEECFG